MIRVINEGLQPTPCDANYRDPDDENSPVYKYFVYKDDENMTGGDAFGDLEEAYEFCIENGGDTIERLIWNDYDSYRSNSADDYKIVWTNK